MRLSVLLRLLSLCCVALALSAFSTTCPSALAHTVLRGLDDPTAFAPRATNGAASMREIGHLLGASVVRADIDWDEVEPQRGVYDEAYLSKVSGTIDAARAQGMSVIVTSYRVPRWASDRSFWSAPPNGFAAGEYQAFYPMRADRLDDYRRFAEHLARRLAGRVMAYECWNEPNLWSTFYPQRTAFDANFAAHRYIAMVRAFSAGIRSGDPAAQVVVGATAPSGRNDRLGTSPQRFARLIQEAGVEDLFDVYSHHPYVVGGTKNVAPEQPPRNPSTTVSLSNISELLSLFPDKPFYLTEWGYSTNYNLAFGFSVTRVQQAEFLRRGYAFAGRYPQVRLLIWYTLRDWSPSHLSSDRRGLYLGLRDLSGAKKPAWFAYAGGNTLTLQTPLSIATGSSLLLRGRLTCASIGGVEGRKLVVKRWRRDIGWRTVATTITGEDGYYRVRLWPLRSASYRVSWPGVVRSGLRTVLVR